LINEEHFFSGSNDSSLAIWSISKKKPILTVKNAHKSNESGNSDQTSWIISVASFHNTDLVASGKYLINYKRNRFFHYF
jgi:WD40 repeat protein